MHQNIAIIGAQWGDEGKGKIVDLLSEKADVIARFQGGHNAGHTLTIGDNVYKLTLIPSGIVRSGKISVIGNGVVVNPWALMKEIEALREQGLVITPDNLYIAENCCLILPFHSEIDILRESAAGQSQKIGTTGRGIGPAYEDKVGRRALRMIDLMDISIDSPRLLRLIDHHNWLRKGAGVQSIDVNELIKSLLAIREQVLPFMKPVSRCMNELNKQKKKILFEGAQGVMLDCDYGTYPYVTSSNTTAGNAAIGTGLGPDAVHYVLGLSKAYATRVGSGPFPTEQNNPEGELMGQRGREFGTVTGRKRRCGWLDLVLLKRTIALSGIKGICLTKLDVLDAFETIKVCVGYELEGKTIDYFPELERHQNQLKPVYLTLPGWQESTYGIRSFDKLPQKAKDYLKAIESIIETPIVMISTSPEREDTIFVESIF